MTPEGKRAAAKRCKARAHKKGSKAWYALKASRALSKRLHEHHLRLACPAWADRAEIKAIYAVAIQRSHQSGKPYEVDHIVPLRGKNVSGLHVPWNLRVVPRTVNRQKCNRLVADATHLRPEQVPER